MKTVIDAVNEFKGEMPPILIDHDRWTFYRIEGANRSAGYSYDGEHVCNFEEFNQEVEDMTNNKGWENKVSDINWDEAPEGATHYAPSHDIYSEVWIKNLTSDSYDFTIVGRDTSWINSGEIFGNELDMLTSKPVTLSSIYTETMNEDRKLPPIGSEYLDEDNQLCKALFHHSCFVIGQMLEHFPISQYPVFSTSRNDRIKPITPPIKLDDGKAYQFNIENGLFLGFYRESRNSFFYEKVNGNKICGKSEASNIQPLTVEVK